MAVFMADSNDPLHLFALPEVLDHVREKDEVLVRLHIRMANRLYRSIDPKRTFELIWLDPVLFSEVTEVEVV